MGFDDFISKWNNKGLDFDGSFGNQCMDLMHQYCVEVLNLTDGRILAAPAAKDVYLNFSKIFGREHFIQIPNSSDNVPQKGDIILWGLEVGAFGHVAIFVDGNGNSFRSFDQNFPVGSKCHLQSHNYRGVLGWLRSKTTMQQTNTPPVNTDMISKEQLIIDAYQALCGEFPTDDEKKYLLGLNYNTMQIIGYLTGDQRFKNKFVTIKEVIKEVPYTPHTPTAIKLFEIVKELDK